ncbi:MAG: DNRLRE domain-containing protein, partial [Chloroflexi bacterium]
PGDTNAVWDIFVRDTQTGTTRRVSVDSNGVQGNGDSAIAVLSADGRYIAFRSRSTNLVPDDTNGVVDVFLFDTQTGMTTRVSVDSNGAQANNTSDAASLSADGSQIAFASDATNLVVGDTNSTRDIFLHRRGPGSTPPTATPTNTPIPTATPPYSYDPLYLSLTSSQTIGGVSSADEDILYFDGTNWQIFFDGSDVGVGSSDLFAFSIPDADTILMSFNTNVTVNGIPATPQDVLRFDATSLGSTTAGTFSLHFDGSDVGLSDATNEKIDALSVTPDGHLLISTSGNPSVPGLSGGKDEDMLAFTSASLGDVTSGTWSLYFDGSDVGLAETSGEDVDAFDILGENIYLSTQGDFSVDGLTGADEDVFVCAAGSVGDITACDYSSSLYFDGSTWGLSGNDVDAFQFHPSGPPPPTAVPTDTPTGPTNTPTHTPTATATPSPTVTATPSSTGSTLIFTPLDDAYVNAGSPTTNYGSSTTLRTDASPDLHSYLRFDVQGLSGAVTKATLRVYANSPSSLGCIASRVDDNTWTEATVSYNNAPAVGNALGSSGAFGGAEWINIDVTTYITGNGAYNLALTTSSGTAISLASREAGANAPQLIIETTP